MQGDVSATGLETTQEMFWQNVGALCPCPKNRLEATFKNFGLMTEETEDSSVLTVTEDINMYSLGMCLT